jgi:hypothetical protein
VRDKLRQLLAVMPPTVSYSNEFLDPRVLQRLRRIRDAQELADGIAQQLSLLTAWSVRRRKNCRKADLPPSGMRHDEMLKA